MNVTQPSYCWKETFQSRYLTSKGSHYKITYLEEDLARDFLEGALIESCTMSSPIALAESTSPRISVLETSLAERFSTTGSSASLAKSELVG